MKTYLIYILFAGLLTNNTKGYDIDKIKLEGGEKMKILVAFYSRTGTTKKVAETMSGILKCDMEEIVDMKSRKGLWGWIMSGKDATQNNLTTIKEITKAPDSYDLIIIGTPIWASKMTPAVRTYLSQNKEKIKNIAFFCTMGGSNAGNAFKEMESFVGKEPFQTLEIPAKEVAQGTYVQKVKDFTVEILKK
ncbi:MAG: flavodoxin [bacterium]|nr:flavodoxin [bacterium]